MQIIVYAGEFYDTIIDRAARSGKGFVDLDLDLDYLLRRLRKVRDVGKRNLVTSG